MRPSLARTHKIYKTLDVYVYLINLYIWIINLNITTSAGVFKSFLEQRSTNISVQICTHIQHPGYSP